jgi:hypothetical protein
VLGPEGVSLSPGQKLVGPDGVSLSPGQKLVGPDGVSLSPGQYDEEVAEAWAVPTAANANAATSARERMKVLTSIAQR